MLTGRRIFQNFICLFLNLLVIIFLSPTKTYAFNQEHSDETQIQREKTYDNFLKTLNSNSSNEICPEREANCLKQIPLFALALGDAFESGQINQIDVETQVLNFQNSSVNKTNDLYERSLMLFSFIEASNKIKNYLAEDFKVIFEKALDKGLVDQKLQQLVFSHENVLPNSWKPIVQKLNPMNAIMQNYAHPYPSDPNNRYALARDLLSIEPPIADYKKGKYFSQPRIFMFCRDRRKYHCLMLMKNKDGQFHTDKDGKLWSQPSLGLARKNKHYSQLRGNTPSGVYRIDGVMPEANKTFSFGRFRRFILNFIEASPKEIMATKLLPPSSQTEDWWKESIVARENGRDLFRIHGSGAPSIPFNAYFPFVPTAGCVAQRENTYGFAHYEDQRKLLDEVMIASGLDPIYENEPLTRGLLYVFNIDNAKGKVTLDDLRAKGIIQ